MIPLVLFLVCLFVAIGVGVLAGLSDLRGMVIPNIYSVIVGATFVAAFGVLWLMGKHSVVFSSIWSHVLAAFLMFVVTLILFAVNAIGAADSKLGTVFALWAGVPGFPALLLFMTLTGGLLGVAALLLRKHKPVKSPAAGSWVERVQNGESKVPYGVAIVVGAVFSFYHIGYFSPETFIVLSAAGGS